MESTRGSDKFADLETPMGVGEFFTKIHQYGQGLIDKFLAQTGRLEDYDGLADELIDLLRAAHNVTKGFKNHGPESADAIVQILITKNSSKIHDPDGLRGTITYKLAQKISGTSDTVDNIKSGTANQLADTAGL